jgi:hypothetical protein
MEIPTQSKVVECPECHQRACEACLTTYLKGKNENSGLYTCIVCHKQKIKMKEPNKWMIALRDKAIMFDCAKCNRYWGYHEYASHVVKGLCVKDPSAKNVSS